MADRKLFSEPGEDSGLAVMDREPVVLPEERKMATEMARKKKDEVEEKVKGFLG